MAADVRHWCTRHIRTLEGDLAGGLTGGLASVASYIPMGLVAMAPLGAALTGLGLMAVFTGAIVSGALFTMLRRTQGLDVGSTMRISLVVAGVFAALHDQAVLAPGPDLTGRLVGVIFLLTILSAACTAAFGVSGLGRLVPLIPYPVIAGMLNGGALLTVMVQFQAAIGLEPGRGWDWSHPGMLIVSAVTVALVQIPIPPIRRVPSVLIAGFGGTAVYYITAEVAPVDFVGPLLGQVPDIRDQWHAVIAGWQSIPTLPVGHLWTTLGPAALSIAVMTTLDTLLAASAMQDLRGVHRSAEPDLRAVAAANLAGGLFGGLPVTAGSNPSLAIWRAGGRTWLATTIRLSVLLAAVLWLPGALARLPLSVIAGIVIAGAWQSFDHESLQLVRLTWRASPTRRHEMIGNLAIMLVVMATAVSFGMAAAVLVGGLLSLVLFVIATAGTTVRRRYGHMVGRSRTYRGERETARLLAADGLIEVIELQGAIFFGSANQVAREIEAALARGARLVIIDLWRVTSIDFSGARRLLQVAERFWRAGTDLAIASVRPGTAVWGCLQDFGLLTRLPADLTFSGIEEAADWAERQILSAVGPAGEGHAEPPGAALASLEIPPGTVAQLLTLLPTVVFRRGAVLLRAGDPPDVFFILIEGTVDVLARLPAAAQPCDDPNHRVRLSTLMPGLMVGEMGYLSGGARSADVVARTAVTCLQIDDRAMDQLRRTDPGLAFDLIRAIAMQLERKLRMASVALLSMEE